MKKILVLLILLLASFSIGADSNAARSVSLPFSESFSSNNYSDLLWLNNGASHTHLSSGGWSGGGAASFKPPTSAPGGNGTYSGLGSFNFGSTAVTHVRFLVKFGPTYISTSRSGGGNQQNKFAILNPDSSGTRGILSLTTTDTGDFSIGPCNNSTCKYEAGQGTSPDAGFFYPPGTDAFLLSEYLDEWIAMEYVTDLNNGLTSIYIWTQDGVHDGLYKQYYINQGGGTNSLQILGGYYNGYHVSDANNYVIFDELTIDTSYIGPPSGFLGSGPVCGDGACSGGETCSTCPNDCGACQVEAVCGNSIVESGEQCDDGNTVTEGCAYGQNSCTVCSSGCRLVSGATSYCGDNVCDSFHESAYNCSSDCGSPSTGAVFFQENFDAYNNGSFNSSWYGSISGYSDFTISSDVRSSGQYSLKKTYTSGVQQAGFVTQHFGDSTKTPVWQSGRGNSYQDLHVQYKIYYSNGFDFSAGNNKQVILGTDDGTSHTEQCCNPWVAHYTTIASRDGYFSAELNNKQSSNIWRGLDPNIAGYSSSNRYNIETGKWYTVEIRKRLNDEGQDNGIFEMWVDGEKISSHTGLRFRVADDGTYGTDFSYGTNFLLISTYINNPAPRNQAVYFDDVKMSTGYIGVPDNPSVCGNSIVESGEQCDDGNMTTEACNYGETSCSVCNSTCQLVAGAVSYCGDSVCSSQETCQNCPADCGQCEVVNVLPKGSIDNVSLSAITGWAYDENKGADPIEVHVYIDGSYHGKTTANIHRSDLSQVLGSANHGFVYNLPELSHGNHEIKVFAINSPQGDNPELSNSPRILNIQAPDTKAPSGSLVINSGNPSTESQSVTLKISASDESGIATMKISNINDRGSALEEIFSSEKYWTLSAGEGMKTVYLWLQDNVGNWNTEPFIDTIELISIYPSISDILVDNVTESTAKISWRAVGANYCEVHYGLGSDTSMVETADYVVPDLFELELHNLSSATQYSYFVLCENEYSNTSVSSVRNFNTKTSQVLDIVPPSAVTDLSLENNGPNSVVLYWTSPGDDGQLGTASQYDIRYSLDRISDANWNQAIELNQEPSPLEAGSLQSYIVVGLQANTFYHFAIKTADEIPNWSALSNIGKIKTARGVTDSSSETTTDSLPPGKAKKISVSSGDGESLLTWENPDDEDYAKTVVLQSEESFEANSSGDLLAIHQGVFYTATHSDDLMKNGKHKIVYEGTNEYYRATRLVNGKTYYYAIITMDGVPNYSEPVFIEATPVNNKNTIEKAKKEIRRLTEEYKHLANVNKRLVETVSEGEADVIYNHGQFVKLSPSSIGLYEKLMSKNKKTMSNRQKYALAYFIEYGTPTTKRLGSGERAGVINSFAEAFGALPRSVKDYKDVIKIANGRWPGKKIDAKKQAAEKNFEKIYQRKDNSVANINDDAAVTIMTYGLRPVDRNFESEKRAVSIFKDIYGKKPQEAGEWDIVRAIAYSGAKR